MIAYDYQRAWITNGGAQTLGPWLIAVAHALQVGQPKTAVHATDLALKNWIGDEPRRSILRYVRGEVIRRHMRDPKTAQLDLDVAEHDAPAWLRGSAVRAAADCRAEAVASQKRKPSVGPAPTFHAADDSPDWRSEPVELDGPVEYEEPFVWNVVSAILWTADPRVPANQRWIR
ncbi:MAG: hypothetical protein KF906_05790 [Actinobacteria bacterium]|nr:hypothetical protein [Actinomycetota bacterium]